MHPEVFLKQRKTALFNLQRITTIRNAPRFHERTDNSPIPLKQLKK